MYKSLHIIYLIYYEAVEVEKNISEISKKVCFEKINKILLIQKTFKKMKKNRIDSS